MNKFIYLLLVAVLLISCGDDYYYDEFNAKTNLKQKIYIVPETYSDDPSYTFLPTQNIVVEKGQSLKFVAGYSIGGVLTAHDSAAQYYTSILWEIDGEYFNINTFRYTFKKAGLIQGSLRTIDLFGDTLTDQFQVYVNTPEEITLEYPYDGFNQAIPHKGTSLPFKWKLTGIDEWEEPTCEFFISPYQGEVWNKSLGEVNCNDGTYLWGPLVGDSAQLLDYGIDLTKEYYTFYWGIRYTINERGAQKRTEYSDTFRFTTKILNEDKSILYIPIRYNSCPAADSVNTRITIVSAFGDTLKTISNRSPFTEVYTDIEPQSGIKIYFEELSKKEYIAEPISVDIPAGAAVVVDPVDFIDKVLPQIAAVQKTIPISQDVSIRIYDDGSGMNVNSIKLFIDGEQAEGSFQYNTLLFSPKLCTRSVCQISVQGKDNAKNPIPGLYWKLQILQEFAYITGPFVLKGDTP